VTPDAGQFMDFGHSYAEGAGRSLPVHLLKMVLGIARRQSFQTALSNLWRIITNILRPVKSMAREKYWGAAVRFDQYVAKYTLQPAGRVRFQWVNPFDKDYLSRDLTRRVENGGLTFRLGLQFFLDRRRTPLHVAHEKWHGPIYWVADVTVRPGSGTGRDAEQVSRDIDKMPFNPTHWFDGVVTDFQASRGEAYRASHRNRGASSLADYAHYFSRGCGSEHGS
jgi:hypothetical protein